MPEHYQFAQTPGSFFSAENLAALKGSLHSGCHQVRKRKQVKNGEELRRRKRGQKLKRTNDVEKERPLLRHNYIMSVGGGGGVGVGWGGGGGGRGGVQKTVCV